MSINWDHSRVTESGERLPLRAAVHLPGVDMDFGYQNAVATLLLWPDGSVTWEAPEEL